VETNHPVKDHLGLCISGWPTTGIWIMDLYQVMDTGIICYLINRRGGPEFIFPDVTWLSHGPIRSA
jgi:hypothetical protein